MLTFVQYLQENTYDFTEHEIPSAKGKIVVRSHQQDVVGHKVGISINSFLPKHSTTREHSIAFSVDGESDRGDVPPQSGRHVWSHVERAITSFHNQNISKRPGTHIYSVSPHDSDPEVKEKKDRVYGKLMKRFARRIGGTYRQEGDNHIVQHGE